MSFPVVSSSHVCIYTHTSHLFVSSVHCVHTAWFLWCTCKVWSLSWNSVGRNMYVLNVKPVIYEHFCSCISTYRHCCRHRCKAGVFNLTLSWSLFCLGYRVGTREVHNKLEKNRCVESQGFGFFNCNSPPFFGLLSVNICLALAGFCLFACLFFKQITWIKFLVTITESCSIACLSYSLILRFLLPNMFCLTAPLHPNRPDPAKQ